MPEMVEVDANALRRLVSAVEGFWDDHRFAKVDSNPGWVVDKEAIDKATTALRKTKFSD